MAISTYDELRTAIAGWLNRTDLTDRIPDFIALAESALNRLLDLRMMETEAPLTLANGATSVPLPPGFVRPIMLWGVDSAGRRPLRFVEPGQVWPVTSSGTEFMWSISGPDITFPRPSAGAQQLALQYIHSFALSDDEPTNWLLTNHPDAYLFGALVEAAPYLKDDKALSIWSSRFQKAIDEINRKEARAHSQATLTTSFGRMPSQHRRFYDNGGYGTYG